MSAVEAPAATNDTAPGGAALEVHDITVRFGGLVALNTVSLSVAPATIVGLVGPNGAGKSTLFAAVSGLLRPTAGTVQLMGRDVTGLSPQKRARMGLARTFQQLELFQGLTVREHVVVAYRARHERQRLWRDVVTLGALRPAPKAETERVDQLIHMVGLEAVANTPVASLPLGTSRRVEVARALATSPSVMLLDEPSSGLDARETAQLSSALRQVVEAEGVAMLLVEHDIEMVLGLSSRVFVLDFGQLIAEGTPEAIRKDPAVQMAYLGAEPTEGATHHG